MERLTWLAQRHERARSAAPLRWALFAFLLVSLLTPAARGATFTAALDRYTITLGEQITLSLKFEEASPDAPAVPPVANLQINYVGPASSFSFINGRTTSSVTHNYVVKPRQAGDYTIPGMTVTVGGQKLSSQPLKLTVLKPGSPPPQAIASGTQLAFMKLVLPRKEVYLGETIVAVLQLYFHGSVQNFGNFNLQSLPTEGFTIGNNAQGQQQRVKVGETDYTLVPLLIALTPVKTGKLELGPVSASVVVELPSNRRNRDSLFEQFGMRDPFGANAERKQIILASDAESVNCLPLPTDNVPANFTGAIGEYSLAVSAGPTNVAVGDPITVRIQISGRGALQSIALPEQPAWHDFKTYPSTSSVEPTDPLGMQGTKTFEQIVSPLNTDVRALPAFSFSYFDPASKSYRTLTESPVLLSVRADRSAPLPSIAATGSKQDEPTPQNDIVPIKQRLGATVAATTPLMTQPWFIGAQTIPVLAFIAAFIWRKRTDSLANNPRLRRQRQVAGLVRDGTNELQRLARENRSEQFFATVFRLLQEQLGERLDRPAASITESVIEEQLRPRGVDESTLTALHELFQSCNLARYASVKSSEELNSVRTKLEHTLEKLAEVRM